MTSMNLYSKEQIDDKIPPTTGASVGDVLTVGSSGTEWSTPSGGGITAHRYSTFGELVTDYMAHQDGILNSVYKQDVVMVVAFKMIKDGNNAKVAYFQYDSTNLIVARPDTSITPSSTATSITMTRFLRDLSSNTTSTGTETLYISQLVYYY